MKRSIGLVVAGVFVSGLAGCGSATPPVALLPPKGSAAPGAAAPAASAPAASKPPTLGEEKKSAADVYADARKAFLAASSVHVSGTFDEDEGPTPFDGQLGQDSGRLDERSTDGEVHLLTTGTTTYVKAPASFFDDEDFPDQLDNKWVALPDVDTDERINLSSFLEVLDLPTADAVLPTVHPDVLDGRQVVVLTFTGGATLTVSNEGTPVPLKHSRSSESQTFDGYGAPLTVQAPPDAVRLPGSSGSRDAGSSGGSGGQPA